MDYEAAVKVLVSPRASARNLAALDTFLSEHIPQLLHCAEPPAAAHVAGAAAGAESDAKTSTAVKQLAADFGLPEPLAARVVAAEQATAPRTSRDYSGYLVAEHRAAVRLVGLLLRRFENEEPGPRRQLVDRVVAELLADAEFFPRIFMAIGHPGPATRPVLPELLDLVFTALFYVIADSSMLILQWMQRVVKPTKHFAAWAPSDRARGILTTLQFLNVHQDFSLQNPRFSYIKDGKALADINGVMNSAPPPVALCWALVLHQVALRYIEHPDKELAPLLAAVPAKGGENLDLAVRDRLATALAHAAVPQLVELLAVLPASIQRAQPVADVLQELLACVHVTDRLAAEIAAVVAPFPALAADFFKDQFAAAALELAQAKVPVALATFVELALAAGPLALDLLQTMRCFIDWSPTADLDIDGPVATATKPLVLFPPRVSDGQGAVVVPAGAQGEPLGLDDTRGALVLWSFNFNGWSLLARVLENAAETSASWEGLPLTIVKLITRAVGCVADADDTAVDGIAGNIGETASGAVDQLLGALSAPLGRGDIIELIFNRFEAVMADVALVDEAGTLLEFFTALLPVLPHRVWSQLSRSRLLEHKGQGGFAAAVVGAVEIFSTRYDFTLKVIGLTHALVSDYSGTPLQRPVFAKLVRHLLDVFESFLYWAYERQAQRSAILRGILSVFELVLDTQTGAGRSSPGGGELAAELVDRLLAGGARTVEPLCSAISAAAQVAIAPADDGDDDSSDSITDGADMDDLAVYTAGADGAVFATGCTAGTSKGCAAALTFCARLVALRSQLDRPYSLLERRLYELTPALVTIYRRHPALRVPVLNTLEALVAAGGQDQPSLLAYLGLAHSEQLLNALTETVASGLALDELLVAVSSFVVAVARSQQEGLLVLLVSGEDLRRDGRLGRSLVQQLQGLVADSTDLSPRVVAAVLTAVALAAPPASSDDKLCGVLVARVRAFAAQIDPAADDALAHGADAGDAFEILAVARAVQILTARSFRDKKLPPALAKFVESMAGGELRTLSAKFLPVRGFDIALHERVHDQFVAWKTVPVAPNTVRLAADPLAPFAGGKGHVALSAGYGPSYVYPLEALARARLSHWKSAEPLLERANIGLSLLDAQTQLIRYWRAWCLSLASPASEGGVGTIPPANLAAVAQVALDAPASDPPTPFFATAGKLRIDLAFYILHLQRKHLKFDRAIVGAALRLLPDVGPQGGAILVPESYRYLLRVLNFELALPETEKDTESVMDVLSSVTVRDARELGALALAGTPVGAYLTEVVLVLRQALQALGSNLPALAPQLVQLVHDSGVQTATIRLYSYALDVAKTEPNAGELALQTMNAWLAVPGMADELSGSGLLTVLVEAPLSREIRKGGVQAGGKLHAVWRRGLLPVALGLLQALGARVATDTALFIDCFKQQVRGCQDQWTSPTGEVSVALVEETVLLALLLAALGVYAPLTPTPPTLDTDALVGVIDHLLSHQKYLYTRIRPQTDASLDLIAGELADLRQLL